MIHLIHKNMCQSGWLTSKKCCYAWIYLAVRNKEFLRTLTTDYILCSLSVLKEFVHSIAFSIVSYANHIDMSFPIYKEIDFLNSNAILS